MADISPKENLESRPNLHFYHVDHSDEKADESWEHIKNADIFLIEFVASKEQKQYIENIVNTGAMSTPEDKARACRDLRSLLQGPEYFLQIATRVINTGKELHLIDVDENDKASEELSLGTNFLEKAASGYLRQDYDNSLSDYVEFIDLYAKSGVKREKAVANEIQTFLDSKKDSWAHKNIVVIQGAIHTSTYHRVKNSNPNANLSRAFPTKEFYYGPTHALIRKIGFGKPVFLDDYKRGYLELLVISDALEESKGNSMNDEERFRASTKIAGEMSALDVEKYWQELKAGKLDTGKLISKYLK